MDFEQQFPSTRNLHYLNHAAIAPWPQRTADAVRAFAEENAARGGLDYGRWMQIEQLCRGQFARLLNAGNDDIALVKNTSEGLSLTARGIHWQPGDNIVLPADEFPSNWLAWRDLQPHGVTLKQIDIRAPAHRDDPEQALIDACDEHTRLLAASAIQYQDGWRLDLPKLGAFCHGNGILFSVDAIQQLGMLPLDVERCRIDFLSADAHKWLLGPEGLAVFYTRPKARAQLRLCQSGWRQYDGPFNFDREQWHPSATARRFEPGSPNTLGITATSASLDLLLEIGLGSIAERALANAGRLREALSRSPHLALQDPPHPRQRSAIISFIPRRCRPDELQRRLRKKRLFCAARGSGIRLSPHFYQQPEQMEQAAELICAELAED